MTGSRVNLMHCISNVNLFTENTVIAYVNQIHSRDAAKPAYINVATNYYACGMRDAIP
jgi:hypothetical protein